MSFGRDSTCYTPRTLTEPRDHTTPITRASSGPGNPSEVKSEWAEECRLLMLPLNRKPAAAKGATGIHYPKHLLLFSFVRVKARSGLGHNLVKILLLPFILERIVFQSQKKDGAVTRLKGRAARISPHW
jgi:hypothetical protein